MPDQGKSIIEYLTSDNITDALSTITDIGIDKILAGTAAEGIPFFSTAISLARSYNNAREKYNIEKIAAFLKAIGGATTSDRINFIRDLDMKHEKDHFIAAIFLLIDQADSVLKPDLMGKIMRACIQEEISYPDAMRVCFMINRCYASDIQHLRDINSNYIPQDLYDAANALFSAGLLANEGIRGGDDGGTIYARNKYGDILLKYGLL